MNRRLVPIVGIAFFSALVLATSASALTVADWELSITTAADALISAQNNDGSFDWVNNGNPNDSGAINIQGATARGLVAAYKVTGNSTYLNAANRTADWLKANSTALYNKDIEFLYELAASGGSDYTDFAKTQAVAYINSKVAQEGGSGAEAVYSRYLNANWTSGPGVMDGAKLWMIGEWGHVANLLDGIDIYAGYTGAAMAQEVGTLVTDFFSAGTGYDYGADPYGFLGLVGVVEGAAFGGINTYGQAEIDAVQALLASQPTDWQDAGYKAYALSLYGLGDPTQLSEWINAGYFDTGTGAYLETMGEALLGAASSAPVPEPGTMVLLGSGLMGLAGWRRRASR